MAGRAEGRADGTPPHDWNEALLLAIVWGLPNTQQFLLGEGRPADARLIWRPTLGWAAVLGISFGCAFTYSIIAGARVSEFIYFIF